VAAAGAQDLDSAPGGSCTNRAADAIQVCWEAGTGGRQSVLLAKGDRVYPINEAETLDDSYRVESIGETEVTLTYLPLAREERIPVNSSLPVAASDPVGFRCRGGRRAGRDGAHQDALKITNPPTFAVVEGSAC